MERIIELQQQYSKLPNEIKSMKRWVCFNKIDKIPRNPMNGGYASVDKSYTWTTFNVALLGCVKYNFDGLGFMLGEGLVGIDLDNHIDEKTGKSPLSDEEFKKLINEFVSNIDSYAELSQSGQGVHIICKAHLPEGNKKSPTVEMYDTNRYFAMSGNVVNDMPIECREAELYKLWEKYLGKSEFTRKETDYTKSLNNGAMHFGEMYQEVTDNLLSLSDNEIIEKIQSSKNGVEFIRLYNGDMSEYSDDHSAADMALCQILAFWCARNKSQMDRIFRTSALMRPKWDARRGKDTYGNITLDNAINSASDVFTPSNKKSNIFSQVAQANKIIINNNESAVLMNLDENGDPIFNSKKIFKHYSLTDTGNAERFYDYFGNLFRWNKKNKNFMFWTGKTWINDDGNLIAKKYADIIVKILKEEVDDYDEQIKEAVKNGQDEEAKDLKTFQEAARKNMTRVANSAGKEAMLKELQHLHGLPCTNTDFDMNPELLNTDSGVVDLRTGEIKPFDAKLMLSKNTNCKVSFEEPKTWLKFLNDIFQRGKQEETQEIIDCIQMCLGYSLSGLTTEQCMFMLYGDGSNGKSTYVETIQKLMGDYAATTPSKTLMSSKFEGSGKQFSLAKLNGARYVSTGETGQGGKLEEETVKIMTGSDKISAAFKGKDEFDFYPQFKVWMSTNHKPNIRGTDKGIWRRIFLFPFERSFSEKEKDKDMPFKLAKEIPSILGWCIRGYIKYIECGKNIAKPKCLEEALSEYKSEMDVITRFINYQCQNFPNYQTSANDLYQNYKRWALDDNEYVMPQSDFSKSMISKGYEKKRKSEGFVYIGIKLISDRKGHSFTGDED